MVMLRNFCTTGPFSVCTNCVFHDSPTLHFVYAMCSCRCNIVSCLLYRTHVYISVTRHLCSELNLYNSLSLSSCLPSLCTYIRMYILCVYSTYMYVLTYLLCVYIQLAPVNCIPSGPGRIILLSRIFLYPEYTVLLYQ